jgi:hypothetical protein
MEYFWQRSRCPTEYFTKALHKLIVHLQENRKVFELALSRIRIPAAAAVLFISAGILFWMNSDHAVQEPASSAKQVNVN